MNKQWCSVSNPWRFYTDPDRHHWLTDPDTALFCSNFQDANTKVKFCPKFFCFFLTEGKPIPSSVFKENKFLISHKNCRNQGFPFFYMLTEGSGSVPIIKDPEWKVTVPRNPEPEHFEYEMITQVVTIYNFIILCVTAMKLLFPNTAWTR